jgi:hypothetical protein
LVLQTQSSLEVLDLVLLSAGFSAAGLSPVSLDFELLEERLCPEGERWSVE